MTVQDINYDAHGNFKGFVFWLTAMRWKVISVSSHKVIVCFCC
jgi:hypothetical protein